MKPRRDITLGEMRDECSKRMHICAPDVDGNNECKYFEVCKQMRSGVFVKPCPEVWDLSDPPRFNEAQMALLRGFREIGAKSVQESSGWFCALDKNGMQINIARSLNLCGETLDLAELLGKESNEEH